MNKLIGIIYLVFSMGCIIGSFWIGWLFLLFIGVSCVLSIVLFIINDYKNTKRLNELENKFAKGLNNEVKK